MERPLVIDSWAMMVHFLNESGKERIEKILGKGRKNSVKLFLNEINLGEIYYRMYKEKNEPVLAERSVMAIKILPIELVSVDQEFILAAAKWKARYAISYADAFVVETAMRTNGKVLTGDPEFGQIKEVEIIRI